MKAIDHFFEWLHDEGKDIKTIKAYRPIMNDFLNWISETNGNDDLTLIKPIDIREYIGYLKHTKKVKSKHAAQKHLSISTINKYTACLKTFFSFLSEYEYINDNPMTRIKLKKINNSGVFEKKNINKWLTKEEQDRFFNYMELEKNEFKRLRNFAIVDLMLYAGLRVAEVEQLKMEDIHVNGDVTITVKEGKRGKYADIMLVNKYSKNFRNWMKYKKTLTKDIHIDSDYVFVSERNGKLTSRGIQIMLNKYADWAKMENITPHRFRHSFCKNLANAKDVKIETISKLARHENIQTTLIYIDNSHQEMKDALQSMA